ncbi:MAG TPA: acylphosphatase [Candidatus Binataceae bacterium]|nr:acylphosphatase [Candidatus Binataceae bacterium]
MKGEPQRLHMVISGRVQGVGFRACAYDEARSLGLKGWVRNLASGEVEMVVEGSRESLEILLAWAHLGPSGSRVSDLREDWSAAEGDFADFRIRY